MRKKILGFLIAMLIGTQAYASITVTPTRIEMNANKVRNNYATMAVEIRGDKNQPMRFRIYPGYFKISEKAGMLIYDAKTEDPHNIAKNIRFVPSEFTVPAGKSQKLRVNIANIKALPDGESRAVLFIEDVNAKEVNIPNHMGIGAQLILKTRVGVPIYVDKGKFTKVADVEYFNVVKEKDGFYTETKINSTGNSKVRFNGIVQIIQGKKLIDEYSINSNVVGDHNYYIAKDKIRTDKIKEAGDYTLRLIFYYFDQDGNRKNIKKDAILTIKGEI